jgi:hypothetical protein
MNDLDDLEEKIDDLESTTNDLDSKIDDFEEEIHKIKEGLEVWNKLIEYTIPFSYENKLLKINSFLETTKHPYILKAYREKIKPKNDIPHIINKKRTDDNDWLDEYVIRNSTFLKNSKIFLDIGKNLYWDTKPLLIYYSSSYLLSFFINSFIAFEPISKHHGLRFDIEKNDLKTIKIYLCNGLFSRIVKSLSFIFYDSVFSDYFIDFSGLPLSKENKVGFIENTNKFSINNNYFLLDDLLNDVTKEKLRNLSSNMGFHHYFHLRKDRFISSSLLLKNYILIFIACGLARYNPKIWKEIYEGKTSDLFINFQKALESTENIVTFISNEFERFENKKDFRFQNAMSYRDFTII